MGLLIYEAAEPASAFSVGNDYTTPIAHTFDGVQGAVILRRYFVRNDDPAFSYSNIKVQPIHIEGDNIIDGTDGFLWKLVPGDQEPLEEQWGLVSPGNDIDIPDIGTGISSDTSTYEPFWLRIEVPRGASVKSHEGIKLRITATESAV
jgi:hypothetical protein